MNFKAKSFFLFFLLVFVAFFWMQKSGFLLHFWYPENIYFKDFDFIKSGNIQNVKYTIKGGKLEKVRFLRNRIIEVYYNGSDTPFCRGILVDADFSNIKIGTFDAKVLDLPYNQISLIRSKF